MNKSYITTYNDEITFGKFLLKVWSEKTIFFLGVSIISILFLLLGLTQPKIYKSTIVLNELDEFGLDIFPRSILNDIDKKRLAKIYNNSYQAKFLSTDLFIEFLDKKNYEDLKNLNLYLKKNNVIKKDYFAETINRVSGLKFSLEIKNFKIKSSLFDDYAYFVKKKNLFEFKSNISELILKKIKDYDHDLELAIASEIEFPILKEFINVDNKDNIVLLNQLPNYYNGRIVLELEIENFKKALKNLDNLELSSSPISQQATKPYLASIPIYIFLSIGILVGIFLSITLILIKHSIQHHEKIKN